MKVNTDSILLGAWADTIKAQSILDIGTGSGLIAIMLAQRSEAYIDAIEIEEKAFSQAQKNARNCKWEERINIIKSSLQDFYLNKKAHYDMIITNPPYFVDAKKPTDKSKTLARHDEMLTYNEIGEAVAEMLTPEGRFYLILPLQESLSFERTASIYNLYCSNKLYINPTLSTVKKRVLMRFSKIKSIPEESYLTIHDEENKYTKDYIELTKDFYLNF